LQAWVLHMGPWLGSCTRALGEGPAHGPLAKVLHKGLGLAEISHPLT